MRQTAIILCLYLTLSAVCGQTRSVSVENLPLYGKGDWKTATRYERLPEQMKDTIRERLWVLGCNSSGLYLRFRTNSTTIGARWSVRENVWMHNMSPGAVKGLDLYSHRFGTWQYVGSGKPSQGAQSTSQMIYGMPLEMQEYMLYLPLYDGLMELELVVDSLATVEQGSLNSPRTDRPVVFYGTSITQGGCASRPGMSYSSILSRKLDREAINLGFSGNGRLDYPIAQAMASIANPYCYVLDFVGNCTVEQIASQTAPFVSILRKAHPTTPIVIVECSNLPESHFSSTIYKERTEKNTALRAVFDKIKDKNIYYVPTTALIGTDQEGTVDGQHSSDIGFWRWANNLYPLLKSFEKRK